MQMNIYIKQCKVYILDHVILLFKSFLFKKGFLASYIFDLLNPYSTFVPSQNQFTSLVKKHTMEGVTCLII